MPDFSNDTAVIVPKLVMDGLEALRDTLEAQGGRLVVLRAALEVQERHWTEREDNLQAAIVEAKAEGQRWMRRAIQMHHALDLQHPEAPPVLVLRELEPEDLEAFRQAWARETARPGAGRWIVLPEAAAVLSAEELEELKAAGAWSPGFDWVRAPETEWR